MLEIRNKVRNGKNHVKTSQKEPKSIKGSPKCLLPNHFAMQANWSPKMTKLNPSTNVKKMMK